MMKIRVFAAVFLLAAVGLVAPVAISIQSSAAEKTPGITEDCLDCHDEKLESLKGTMHQIRPEDETATVSCTACHVGDADRHMDDDSYKLMLPSGASVRQTAAICATCHDNSHQQNMEEFNVHAQNDVACNDCHKVHDNDHDYLLQKNQPQLCLDCHPKIEGDFARSFRHPVMDGVMKCSECHLSLDESHRDLMVAGSGIGEVCTQCHNQFQGPFPYDHQATVDYSTQGGSCLACHEAHGSNVPRMLKQPYEGPHHELCSQCHFVPKHQMNSHHDTQWSGVDCNECHVDIHGSYDNRYFLSPSLRAQGCTVAGCHSF